MIPKTKLQKEVFALSKKLPKPNKEQINYAYENCLDRFAAVVRKTIFCLECGHDWKDNDIVQDYHIVHGKKYEDWKEQIVPNEKKQKGPIHIDCPKCKKVLTLTPRYDNGLIDNAYYSIITKKEQFQVVRHFYVDQWMKKKIPGRKSITEVLQFWILPNGKTTVMAIKGAAMGGGYYGDQWSWGSPLTIKPANAHTYRNYNINPYVIFPKKEFIPELIRNGYYNDFQSIHPPQTVIKTILLEPLAEMLLKTGQNSFLNWFINSPDNFKKYWDSIKICIRHKYIIEDESMWKDYIDFLSFFKKDLRNPFYICPKNLKLQHDILMRRKRVIDEEIRLKRRAEDIEFRKQQAANKLYMKKNYSKYWKPYLDLIITDDKIVIRPIQNVREMKKEGIELNHCIYDNHYYEKKDCLCFSARINDKRIETLELNLKTMFIEQSRGYDNWSTEHHEEIIALMQNNLFKIEAIQRKIKKQKSSELIAA